MFDDETIHALIITDPREVYGFNAPPTEPPAEEEEMDEEDWEWVRGNWIEYEDDDEDFPEKGDNF